MGKFTDALRKSYPWSDKAKANRGGGVPAGTVHQWRGKKMQKQADGSWKPVEERAAKQPAEKPGQKSYRTRKEAIDASHYHADRAQHHRQQANIQYTRGNHDKMREHEKKAKQHDARAAEATKHANRLSGWLNEDGTAKSLGIAKARALPAGTVRTHGGRKMVKQADGSWKPQKGSGKPGGERGAGEPGWRADRMKAENRFTSWESRFQQYLPAELRKQIVEQRNIVRGKGAAATVTEIGKLNRLIDAGIEHVTEAKGTPSHVNVLERVGTAVEPPYQMHHRGGEAWVETGAHNLSKVRASLEGQGATGGPDRWKIGTMDVRIFHEGDRITVQASSKEHRTPKQRERAALRRLAQMPGVGKPRPGGSGAIGAATRPGRKIKGLV